MFYNNYYEITIRLEVFIMISINNIEFLTTQKLSDALISKENKLVLEGTGNLEIRSVAFIKNTQRQGFIEIDSLDKIAETLEKIDWKNLTNQQSQTLLDNYRWIHQKIESHNSHIEQKARLRFLHTIMQFFSGGKHGLKYEHTLESQVRDIQRYLDDRRAAETLLSGWAARTPPFPSEEEEKLKTALCDFTSKYNLSEEGAISSFAVLLPTLTPVNREVVMGTLSSTEKNAVFKNLSFFTKMTIFRELPSSAAKAALFNELDVENAAIFIFFSVDEKNEILSQLSDEQKIKRLLIVDEPYLESYFNQTSFLEEYKLQGLTLDQAKQQITPDQTKLLVRLLQLKHPRTVLEIQNFPLLRELVREELKKYLVSREMQPGTQEMLDAVDAIDKLQALIPHENLLQILIYIRENYYLMVAGAIGQQGKNRPEVRKIKATQFKVPVTVEYSPGRGDVIVKLGFLGAGNFKVVKQQLHLAHLGKEFPRHAISKQADNEEARHEIEIMERARGLPNVIDLYHTRTYFSAKTGQQTLVLETPLYNGGELAVQMKKSTPFPRTEKLRITADILRGVAGLHSREILHRDIKPANIFLHKTVEKGNEVVRAIVGDLGLSCFRHGDYLIENIAGSPLFIPPEVLNGSSLQDYSSDAWALGIMLTELFTGIEPFPSARTFVDVYQGGLAFEKNPPPADSNSIEYVIWKLLRPKPVERMTVQEALTIVERLLASADNNPQTTVS